MLCSGETVGSCCWEERSAKSQARKENQQKADVPTAVELEGGGIIQNPGQGSTRPFEGVRALSQVQPSLFHSGGLVGKGGRETYAPFHPRMLRTELATFLGLCL